MDVKELLKRQGNGENFEFYLFWGGFCSQWIPSPFKIDGIRYATCEQYMMAEKARTFRDEGALSEIMASTDPRANKATGRKVKDFNFETWDEVKFDIVVKANMAKFSQNEDLLKLLLRTGTEVIVEASPFDKIWGIGLGESDPLAKSPHTWDGENLLGFALMDVRDVLAG